jgi:hypothetical protein
MHKRNTMAAAAATAVALGASTVAMAGTPFNTTGSGLPIVYNAKITNQVLALGPQWNPTHVLDTPPLKGGRYVVNYQVGAVIGRLDNVVCAAWIKDDPSGNTNDGVFGTAGNGSVDSGTGPAGIYGSASAVDVISVHTGQQLTITCNSANGDRGTYIGSASIVATKIGTLTQ